MVLELIMGQLINLLLVLKDLQLITKKLVLLKNLLEKSSLICWWGGAVSDGSIVQCCGKVHIIYYWCETLEGLQLQNYLWCGWSLI